MLPQKQLITLPVSSGETFRRLAAAGPFERKEAFSLLLSLSPPRAEYLAPGPCRGKAEREGAP
jgi:hypothetical protein